ncbi:MAG TPA: sigma-70 family RNA polymerase sigma factor [Isosphaeraceae bacterium]|jgi:RNA polymerase sigma-70 factor (ECF subfamily)|nr:sigma-70 family RNA polymerase sigma factor [Isosphaeraceae bacterium]
MYLTSNPTAMPNEAECCSTQIALGELEAVYGFIYSRVGSRTDAEDLTQEVAVKALPRLRCDAAPPEIRGYLYATARSVLAAFWSGRLRLPESELPENLGQAIQHEFFPSAGIAAQVRSILDSLTPNQRRVLELRFLLGYSLREVADEMGKTIGSVKLMQLRALRSAAAHSRPALVGGMGSS